MAQLRAKPITSQASIVAMQQWQVPWVLSRGALLFNARKASAGWRADIPNLAEGQSTRLLFPAL